MRERDGRGEEEEGDHDDLTNSLCFYCLSDGF